MLTNGFAVVPDRYGWRIVRDGREYVTAIMRAHGCKGVSYTRKRDALRAARGYALRVTVD